MSEQVNVILAPMSGQTVCTTKMVFQYSRGMKLRIIDKDLPDHYRVEFANSVTGQSTGQLCTDGIVSVPSQYFVPGSYIYAWIVMVSEEYAVPIKTITIPIAQKAQYIDAEPDPEPTSIIDEAIGALNGAVGTATAAAEDARLHERMAADCATLAENAASRYPRINNGYWEVWDVSSGAYVSTGVQAEGIGLPAGGTQGQIPVKKSYADNDTEWRDIPVTSVNGQTGDVAISIPTKVSDLQNDRGFITGYTETDPTVPEWAKQSSKPTYTPSEIGLGNVANERQYSANNPPPADKTKQDKIAASGILKGDGNGGVSAAVAGTDYGTYSKPATGIPASDIADGVIPDVSGKADKVFGATNGNFAALDANGNLTDSGHKHSDYLTEHQTIPVTDVQVDGTSVLSNGVANVPAADANTFGVVKKGSSLSIDANGKLGTNNAGDTNIKDGTSLTSVLTPGRQHQSVFYGLAKAAGDSSQSASSNAVGEYTAEAKKKIRMMLGVPNTEWELINEVTLTEDSTEIKINTDSNGQAFELTNLVAFFSCGPSTTGTRDSFYGQFLDNFLNNSVISSGGDSFPSLYYPSATSNMAAQIIMDTHYPGPITMQKVAAASPGQSANIESMAKNRISESITEIKIYQSAANKSLVPAGAKLTLWGVRK